MIDGTRVAIACGSAKFSLPTMPVEDYPDLPEIPENTGAVPADLFSEAVSQVAIAAGKDDTLPMLTGVRVEIEGDKVVLAATDRFRLAVRELQWLPAESGASGAALVPAKTLSEAAKSAGSGGSGNVELAFGSAHAIGSEGMLGITSNAKKTTTRLLDAEFPKFRQLFPANHLRRDHRERTADRIDQARLAGRRARRTGSYGLHERLRAAHRRWR